MSPSNAVWTAITNAGITVEVIDDSWGYRHRYGAGGPFISREIALQAALQDLFARLDAATPSQTAGDPPPPAAEPTSQPDRVEHAIDEAAGLM